MAVDIATLSDAVDSPRQLLVIPGRRYTAQLPALYFPIKAFDEAGWGVTVASWGDDELDGVENCTTFVEDVAQAMFDSVSDAEHVLVLGKSVASHAAGWAARTKLRAVWLTPLLHNDAITQAISDSPAETLLIGGTDDPNWNGPAARASGKEVLELKGADHSLQSGDWQELMKNIEVATKTMLGFAMHHPVAPTL